MKIRVKKTRSGIYASYAGNKIVGLSPRKNIALGQAKSYVRDAGMLKRIKADNKRKRRTNNLSRFGAFRIPRFRF